MCVRVRVRVRVRVVFDVYQYACARCKLGQLGEEMGTHTHTHTHTHRLFKAPFEGLKKGEALLPEGLDWVLHLIQYRHDEVQQHL